MSTVDNNSVPARGTDGTGRWEFAVPWRNGRGRGSRCLCQPGRRAAFLWASQKKQGDVFTLNAPLWPDTGGICRRRCVASSLPTHLRRADLPLGRRKTLSAAPWVLQVMRIYSFEPLAVRHFCRTPGANGAPPRVISALVSERSFVL